MQFPRRSRFKQFEPCPQCRSRGKDTRGDNLATYYDGSAYCFSCGYTIHASYSNWSKPVEIDDGSKSVLPADFTTDVPAYAWKWLLRYGLPWSYWSPKCGYSPKECRLIFKVGHPTRFSIGRKIHLPDQSSQGLAGVQSSEVVRQDDGGLPVHGTSSSERKWRFWGDKTKYVETVGDVEKTKSICLVEDLISAHKIGQIACAIPLFGTSIYPLVIKKLRELKKPIILWLDKDQEDSVKKKAVSLQMLTNLPVDTVITLFDPKVYSTDDIKNTLKSKEVLK